MIDKIYRYLEVQRELQTLKNKIYSLNLELKEIKENFIGEIVEKKEFVLDHHEDPSKSYLVKLKPSKIPRIKVLESLHDNQQPSPEVI